MKRYLSIIAILIVVAAMQAVAPASAANVPTIIINGGVYDWDDNPVSATVTLNYGGVDHTDLTDSEGQYTFLDVPADTPYTLHALAVNGFSTRTYDGDTDLSGEMSVDLELEYVSIYGMVNDEDDNAVIRPYVNLYYGGENHRIRGDNYGQFVYEIVPTYTDFQLYAIGDGSNSNVIDDSTEDYDLYDLVLRFGPNGGSDTTSIEGYVTDQNGNPIDGARVILEYGEDDEWMDAYTEDEGYYYFEEVPVGVDFDLFAYIVDTDFESNSIEGTTTYEMDDQNLVIDMVGTPSGSPTPTPTPDPVYHGPWTINNTEWYYNDTNPFPVPAVVSTPVPTPAPTPVPTSAPSTGGNGGIVTVTPTVTPTPTPVPSSSENTSLSSNLWWILLLILVAAAVGVWYVTRHK
jgi:hypothetical protein